jgi:tRNA (guanine-N7-)-methyltransferase
MRKPARLPPEALAPYVLETPPPESGIAPTTEIIDWSALFGNTHSVEIEVGFGKGLFLVTAASANPQTNYFGIEVMRKYQLFAATRLAKRELRNVRVMCADARRVMQLRVREGSVRTIHLYFPDPWWKTRHHKRRVFTPEFAVCCERALEPGGALLVATDVEDYAAMVRETVEAHTRLRESAPPAESAPSHDMDYLTNFERKFRQQGKSIHRMRYERG